MAVSLFMPHAEADVSQSAPGKHSPRTATAEPTVRVRRRGLRSRFSRVVTAIVVTIVVGIGLTAGLWLVLASRHGTLVVSVGGPDAMRIDGVQVFVDGVKRCSTSPCLVAGLKPGTHKLRVASAGYTSSAQRIVHIRGCETTLESIVLSLSGGGCRLRVVGGDDLTLFINGVGLGTLPQELSDLDPGEYLVRVTGSERFAPFEEQVRLERGDAKTLGPVALRVVRGLARVELGKTAVGARVWLVSSKKRQRLPQLPWDGDIDTDRPYRLVASKAGFPDYEQPVEFKPGEPSRTFVVEFGRGATTEALGSARESPGLSQEPAPTTAERSPGSVAEPPQGATGTLRISSVPEARIFIDGVPRGKSPKSTKVAAGQHTVVFIHEELGRRVVAIKVPPGEIVDAAVSFQADGSAMGRPAANPPGSGFVNPYR